MKTKALNYIVAFFAGVVFVHRLCAQSTAFTYQGQLTVEGAGANGIYDMQFSLYDSLSDGAQQGSTLQYTNNITNGLFTAMLDFGPDIFNGDGRWLEIAVSPHDSNTFVTLHPRQALTPAPYALVAGKVLGPIDGSTIVAGSITAAHLADGAVTAEKIATHSITANHLVEGAAVSNLAANGLTGIPSSGLVLSATQNSALSDIGYVEIGAFQTGEKWVKCEATPILEPRASHTAVWTGSEMITWGGSRGGSYFLLNNGGRYNPETHNWIPMSTNGAPSVRLAHKAIWTGIEMIVWGGSSGGLNSLDDGGRYNPVADTWEAIETNGAPSSRYYHTVVWTGNEMIVWGGFSGTDSLNTGGRYFPDTDTWLPMSTNNAPMSRRHHTAVWTGTEMIVWGGYDEGYLSLNSGGRYNPVTDTWSPINNYAAPLERDGHVAVWTGDEMIVWGSGYTNFPVINYFNFGGRYDPALDAWSDIESSGGAPDARSHRVAVWTGNDMVILGGEVSGPYYRDARYRPDENSWRIMERLGTINARKGQTVIWTGDEVIIWGGRISGEYFNDTWSYSFGEMMYLYRNP